MKPVWKMTKAQLQVEAEALMRRLNMRRVFGGPVSKDEWEREVLDLREQVEAEDIRLDQQDLRRGNA